jgi:hypothetical protein
MKSKCGSNTEPVNFGGCAALVCVEAAIMAYKSPPRFTGLAHRMISGKEGR